MGWLGLPLVDRREAAITAALGGAVLIIGGYGTGLGISNVDSAAAVIARPASPSVSTSPMSVPAATLPAVSALPPATVQAASAAAPILTAPVPTYRVLVVTLSSPQRGDSTTSCSPKPGATLNTGLLSSLDLSGVISPVTNLLGGLPLLGGVLGTAGASSRTACLESQPCCAVARREATR